MSAVIREQPPWLQAVVIDSDATARISWRGDPVSVSQKTVCQPIGMTQASVVSVGGCSLCDYSLTHLSRTPSHSSSPSFRMNHAAI